MGKCSVSPVAGLMLFITGRSVLLLMSLFVMSYSYIPNVSVASERGLSAYESVEQSTRQLLARLKEIQPLYRSDPEQFFVEIEDALNPHIDFDGFSKGVMSRYYKVATPVQRQEFREKFRHSLVRSYATAFVEFDNQRVVVNEPNKPPKTPDRAMIKIDVHTRSGAVIPLQYLMVKKDDKWLLRNITVNGINIGLQFRSQFSGFMQKYNKDIDMVISQWPVK